MLYFDEKGPLIFSASIHFALIVFFLVYSMIKPEKKPEELVFELYTPPSPVAAPQDTPIEYTPEPNDLPTLDDIPDPVIEDVLEPEPEPEPEPVEEAPLKEVEPPPEKISFTDFVAANPIQKQRIPAPKPPKPRTINIDVSDLQKRLENIDIEVPTVVTRSVNSSADQNRMMSYFSSLIKAITDSIEQHPLGATPLSSKVQFDLAPTGVISGARITVSSGDTDFDRKVLEGFKRLGRYRPPPDWTSTQNLILTIHQPDR